MLAYNHYGGNFAYIYNNQFYTTTVLMTWCLDQVQIDFPIRLSSNYANGIEKVLGNKILLRCPNGAHPTVHDACKNKGS